MPIVPASRAMETPPDWVCEVLSPATVQLDRVFKANLYARVNVRHVGLVDPVVQMLETDSLVNTIWNRVNAWMGHASVRAEPFTPSNCICLCDERGDRRCFQFNQRGRKNSGHPKCCAVCVRVRELGSIQVRATCWHKVGTSTLNTCSAPYYTRRRRNEPRVTSLASDRLLVLLPGNG